MRGLRPLTNLPVLPGEGKFTERLGFKSRTKQNQNPSFFGASEKRGVCNQSEAALVRGLSCSVDASDLAINDERRHCAITAPT